MREELAAPRGSRVPVLCADQHCPLPLLARSAAAVTLLGDTFKGVSGDKPRTRAFA